MKGNNIVLVGMMGAGKTTVGKLLGEMISDYEFADIDSLIEDAEDLTIPALFEMYSEEGFRKIEEITIEETCKQSNLIISTGGGAFQFDKNRENLLNSGKVFYLYSPYEVLYDRIKAQGNRPLLDCENPKQKCKELLDKRDENYRKADFVIDTSSLTPELTAKEILRRVNETVNIR